MPRDTDNSEITNPLASTPGYPAELEDGTTVSIVDKTRDGQNRELLVDTDGNQYVLHETQAHLVPLEKTDEETDLSGRFGSFE